MKTSKNLILLAEIIRISQLQAISWTTNWTVKLEVDSDDMDEKKELINMLLDANIRFKSNFGELIIYFH